MITKVIFRKFNNGEIIAIFPETLQNGECDSYMHIGQHGACTSGIPSFTKLAKPSEYRDLKKELESIGYKLKIVKKIMREKR